MKNFYLILFLIKKKIKLFSYFDKKGAKKFLSEKDKAMKKITLFDEILDENASTKKIHKDKKLKKKARRSISDNLSKFKIKKSSDKKNSTKNIKKSQMVISINYIDDGKNNDDKTNLYSVNKKAVTKYNSISSNYSNIMPSSPKNLIMNKNDSLIFSIVSEMSKN